MKDSRLSAGELDLACRFPASSKEGISAFARFRPSIRISSMANIESQVERLREQIREHEY
jgi:hypothetical protein